MPTKFEIEEGVRAFEATQGSETNMRMPIYEYRKIIVTRVLEAAERIREKSPPQQQAVK